MQTTFLIAYRWRAASLLVASALLGGCVASSEAGDVAADLSAPSEVASIEDELAAVLPLPDGAEVRFYAHEDGSFSVVEVGDAKHRTVMKRPEFAEATAFDLFHALAAPEREVPRSLVTNHEVMRAEATRAPSIDSSLRPQGWLLASLQAAPETQSLLSACDESIDTFVCDEAGSSYPDGPGCFASSTGVLAWYDNSDPMRRYRTGFCTTGTVEADITYSYSGPGDCIVFRPLFILRDGLYTNINWHYNWIGPSGATPRGYSNRVEHVSGAGFGWGVREKEHTSSSCTI